MLLVDDDPALLLPMSRYFARLGYEVNSARKKDEALAVLATQAFDIVILDVQLGDGDNGLDILQHVRGTPVLVLSGLVATDLPAYASSLGAGAVLQKPQPLHEIARVAADLMNGTTRP
jgi:DNA-binding response OmpR family regulator